MLFSSLSRVLCYLRANQLVAAYGRVFGIDRCHQFPGNQRERRRLHILQKKRAHMCLIRGPAGAAKPIVDLVLGRLNGSPIDTPGQRTQQEVCREHTKRADGGQPELPPGPRAFLPPPYTRA
jgi:hypothetical protein